jgi:ribonuclease R
LGPLIESMLTEAQKNRVLQFIQSLKTGGFTFRDVVRALDVDSDHRRSLQNFLNELDSEGIIHRVKRSRYTLPAREDLVSGVLQCHPDGYGFLIPDDRMRHREDIFIPARGMEAAVHEDRVLVKLVHKNRPIKRRMQGRRVRRFRNRIEDVKERIEGSVVRVLERRHPTIVGKYFAHPRFPFVVPLDTRMICDIRIPYHLAGGARDGQIVAATMTLPPGRNQVPQGRITEILGFSGEPGIEYKIVEHKFGLPVHFSPEALEEAEAIPDRVLKEEYEGREDFREEPAITIDGETARDFDDSVSVRKLASGNYELAVHIADVSHYVREDTVIDSEAYARGTSVYFPDRAIPMLPPQISGGICSLKPDADRLVLSAIIEVGSRGRIIGKRFAKGVLRSRARMTYASVAKILLNKDPVERKRYAGLIPVLETMEELCRILSKKRLRRGSVDFDLPEAEIRFDLGGKIAGIVPAERNIAHRIIEEFMLLANECVAEILSSSGGPALYRVHEKPDPAKVEAFAEFALSLGYRLEKSDGEYRPKDFQKFVLQLEGKPEQKFLAYLMLRSFMQARYSERNLGHFGLAAQEYTHFTSPIRRYPDLVTHRLLKQCISAKTSAAWLERIRQRLPEIAAHSSSRERIADEAEREIEKIKKAQFMADKIGEEFEAIVLSTSRQGFALELLKHYVEGFVPMGSLVDDFYLYREKTRSIVGERRRRRFRPGSRVRVRLDAVDTEIARLTFSVCGG